MEAMMKASELDTLLRDVEELRRAVRRNSPFLREVVSSRLLAVYVLLFGLVVAAFCLTSHVLVGSFGSFAAIPRAWKVGFWGALILLGASAVVSKQLIIGRRAAQVDSGATWLTVIRAVYGNHMFNLYVPAFLCMAAASIFALILGHPWFVVPAIAVFGGFVSNGVGLFIQRSEYFATGWYAISSSLVSLFFLERAPLLWTAVVCGGMYILFGIVSLGRSAGKG
jgi:hypothetical protein